MEEVFLKSFKSYLKEKLQDTCGTLDARSKCSKVGIVGGGIAGLYSALELQKHEPSVSITVLEANDRVGGRIFTYTFSSDPYQYFEAGAMRVPYTSSHSSFFHLIDYLNKRNPANSIKVVDFNYSCSSGNRVLVNGTKQNDGRVMSVEYAKGHCNELGFPASAKVDAGDEANKLLSEALQPIFVAMKKDFKAAIETYAHMSLNTYLIKEAGWTRERVVYFEVMAQQTNTSHTGVLDTFFFFFAHLGSKHSWKTIEGGMSRLPEACAEVIRANGGTVLRNSKVESLVDLNGKVQLGYRNSRNPSQELTYEIFDAVIMALPTSCIYMMPTRPRWPADMEHALRALHHVPVNKIGLRFKSRFWERSDLQQPPSFGGQSVTDLPSRWILYPTHGIGSSGVGVLVSFTFSSDAMQWMSISDVEKIQLVLRDLQLLYPEVDIAGEYAGGTDPSSEKFTKEAYIVEWLTKWSMGVGSFYFPGQFASLYPILAQPRGHIYFAGDHLSTSLSVFIAGALESAETAVQQLISRNTFTTT